MRERLGTAMEEYLPSPDSDVETVRPGKFIYQQGQPANDLVVLQSGVAMLRVDGIGRGSIRRVITELVREGEIMGFETLEENEKYSSSAIALNTCSVVRVGRDELFSLIARDEQFLWFVFQREARHLRVRDRRIVEMLEIRRKNQRVENAIKVFANSSRFLPWYAHRYLLAQYAGCTKAMVSHVFERLERRGVIRRLPKRRIEILKPGKLR